LYVFFAKLTDLVTKEQLFIHLVEELSSSDLFFGHSAIDAEDEAMMILMHLFDESTNEVLNSGSSEVSEAAINQAEQICYQRISERKPLAYIIKKAWFCGVEFKVDERALVPRSPIAELIQNQFKPWFSKENQSCTALDLCTGSGCIGISMSIFMENMKVDISDISREALQLAAENIKNHCVENQVRAIQSDLFENITGKYDLIVTNPPYVSDDEFIELPQEYFAEPKLGLVSENSGLDIPVRILLQAADYLKEGGLLFLEVGYSDELLNDTFPEIDFEWIEFLNGGEGVCVFSREKLLEYQPVFSKFIEQQNVL